MRDLNKEFQDTEDRKYAYDFDYIHRDFMLEHFKYLFKPELKVLEMGCYHGEFTKKLLPHFDSISVVEGASELIEVAKHNVNSNKVKFFHSTFETYETDKTYDLIFLIHTLEHLDDRTLVLNKIYDLLSENGKLVLIVPNANAASRQIAVAMNLIDFNTAVTPGEKEHGHRVTYNLDTLRHEVLSSKLKVVDSGGVMYKPLANFQIDKALSAGIIDLEFLRGCYELGKKYPDQCASIFTICTK